MLQSGFSLNAAKLVMILIFLILTSPVATHAIAQAARQSGLEPKVVAEEDEA
jgi:multicomponent Na+:H+ antiporter subunit G